jgi:ankyrin repeat protein
MSNDKSKIVIDLFEHGELFRNMEFVEYCLKHGIINPDTMIGNTSLFEHAIRSSLGDLNTYYGVEDDFLNMLLKYKADVNIKSNGKTPLFIACSEDNKKGIVSKLLTFKADPNIGGTSSSPLSTAVWNKDVELVSMLLKAKADPNLGEGETFLHKLTYDKSISVFDKFSLKGSDNLNCVKQLLVAKSDLARRNDKGQTPLMSATFWGNYYCLKLLLKYGFKTMTSSDRYYCLVHCSKTDNVDCLKLLLNA